MTLSNASPGQGELPGEEGVVTRWANLMDTHVSIAVVGEQGQEWETAIDRALTWFERIEASCSRFDPQSEVMQLTARVGTPVAASPLLFEATQFALSVAEASEGAFDPTVGHILERRGFNRNYRTGERIATAGVAGSVSWRDVTLDPESRTITLRRALILDLGAVVKGMAIDLAARELAAAPGFAIDAGGDLYVHGRNPEGRPWRIGIRHPRAAGQLLGTVEVADAAVCTSGDYERGAEGAPGHHILDPHSGASAEAVASVTVIGPTAMAADAVGTAAFVLGPARGRRFVESQGLAALIVTPTLQEYSTRGFKRLARWRRTP
jgi:FAD:protein FMN transferase